MATNEQLELREEWASALESGEFVQRTAIGPMRSTEDEYTALGVLAELCARRQIVAREHNETYGYFEFNRNSHSLPRAAVEAVGLENAIGCFVYSDDIPTSIDLMCERGLTFARIATLIRQAPPGLFVD